MEHHVALKINIIGLTILCLLKFEKKMYQNLKYKLISHISL